LSPASCLFRAWLHFSIIKLQEIYSSETSDDSPDYTALYSVHSNSCEDLKSSLCNIVFKVICIWKNVHKFKHFNFKILTALITEKSGLSVWYKIYIYFKHCILIVCVLALSRIAPSPCNNSNR
jgi:hypothetical protein